MVTISLVVGVVALSAAAAAAELNIGTEAEPGTRTEPESTAEVNPDAEAGSAVDQSLKAISGRIQSADGIGTHRVGVDVFRAERSGRRTAFVSSTRTDPAGRFTVEVADPGCFGIVISAPTKATFLDGSDRHEAMVCNDDGTGFAPVIATLAHAPTTSITGRVIFGSGERVDDATLNLFSAAGDGSRATRLAASATGPDGAFRFEVIPGCYLVAVTAPEGRVLVGGSSENQWQTCVDDTRDSSVVEAVVQGSAQSIAALSPVELEIVRLTNELRSEPGGVLRRQRPAPGCLRDPYYQITVDPETGQPVPVPAVTVDETVSVEMARPWATQMYREDVFAHRPSSAQQAMLGQLGIEVTAWGENIAWMSGYPAELTAKIHFEGWRESDTGHYCTMVTERFTHVGVGEIRVENESWAVQNFYVD